MSICDNTTPCVLEYPSIVGNYLFLHGLILRWVLIYHRGPYPTCLLNELGMILCWVVQTFLIQNNHVSAINFHTDPRAFLVLGSVQWSCPDHHHPLGCFRALVPKTSDNANVTLRCQEEPHNQDLATKLQFIIRVGLF